MMNLKLLSVRARTRERERKGYIICIKIKNPA
jgi:hypothetical protein